MSEEACVLQDQERRGFGKKKQALYHEMRQRTAGAHGVADHQYESFVPRLCSVNFESNQKH